MSELINPPAWTADAVCAHTDPDAFFPDKGGRTEMAKRVCNGDPERGTPPCPVREQCLDYALEHHIRAGIWGGFSETERRQLRRQRREAA